MSTAVRPFHSKTCGLLERVTCPHCWEQFSPDQCYWISEHGDLLGDPRLGPDEQQRFLPSRFSVSGDALDARGFPCHQLACPHCHLGLPRPMLELEPLFLSIFGAPASGKSFFLAAMTWELRKVMAQNFAVSFNDADPALNRQLNDYEESVFANDQPDSLVPLANMIRKTEEQGELYDTVSYGNQTVSYPRPFLFTAQPQETHYHAENARRLARVICLYDNAGESFLPGRDTVGSPVTRHLAHSRALFFVFDPTQDPRFRRVSDKDGKNDNIQPGGRTLRQEPIFQEAAARIRRYAKLRQTEKHNRPLIVILTKYDAWSHLLQPLIGEDTFEEPWRAMPVKGGRGEVVHALDVPRIERCSKFARELMLRYSPEIVGAAESFARNVIFVPVSAVGWAATVDRSNGLLSIRSTDTHPYWVTVPFLYALYLGTPGLIPGIKRKTEGSR